MQKTPLNTAQRTRGTNQMLVSRNVTRFVSGAGNLKPLLQMIEAQRVARRDAEIPVRLPTDFWPDWLPSIIRAIAPPMGTRPQRCKDAETQREKKERDKKRGGRGRHRRWLCLRKLRQQGRAIAARQIVAAYHAAAFFSRGFSSFSFASPCLLAWAFPSGNCYGKRPACRWTRSPCLANSR